LQLSDSRRANSVEGDNIFVVPNKHRSYKGLNNLQRISFVLRIAPEHYEMYVERHRSVYPELLQAFEEVRFRTYSIFYYEGLLFNYLEVDDYEQAMKKLSVNPAFNRWQAYMSDMLIPMEGKSVSVAIPEVFYWTP